ncbi:hypothetical protein [Ferrimonas balearica]|uniref:hypothetical protein n=1 Tax=Ferrimonas balearica TaxID=44012 RepID=UPI001F165230|nr:hypothetical protein [Ferrimonas balearica]MBY6093840.1 hypothetical protein [Ferrimonas balearica]
MKTRVHVNQHNIRSNHKNGLDLPVLTVKDYKQNRKGNVALVVDDEGNEVGRFIYSPEKPLPCGARVWFETDLNVQVFPHDSE